MVTSGTKIEQLQSWSKEHVLKINDLQVQVHYGNLIPGIGLEILYKHFRVGVIVVSFFTLSII